MARTREFDTDEAVAQMAQAFWRNGYDATGVAELVDATGVGRASLYGAFGSKRDMLERSLDWYLNETIEPLVLSLESGLDAIEQRFLMFAQVLEAMPERARLGCMMVNVGSEVGSVDEGLGVKAGSYRDRFRLAFERGLTAAVEAGDIEGPVEGRAQLLTLLMMGMFVAIRSGATVEEIAELGKAAQEEIRSWRVS